MKRSIRAVTTGKGTEPSSSTASWKARMLNFAPSVFSMRCFVALLELGELLLEPHAPQEVVDAIGDPGQAM